MLIFSSHYQHFIGITVIKGTAIRQNMVYLCIFTIMQQSLNIKSFLTISTNSLLFLIQFPFDYIQAIWLQKTIFPQFFYYLLICLAIIFHFIMHILAVLETTCHFPCQFDMDFHRTAITSYQCIQNFNSLRYSPAHNGIGNFAYFLHPS